jgi:transposase
VSRILGDGTRQKTRAFFELQSHYLFADKFGRPAKGNDKGKVEGLVGYIRRNFLVPIPRVASWEELNQMVIMWTLWSVVLSAIAAKIFANQAGKLVLAGAV